MLENINKLCHIKRLKIVEMLQNFVISLYGLKKIVRKSSEKLQF